MPVDITVNSDEYATCVIASEDKGRFVQKEPSPRQPPWWDQPTPKDNPLKDLEVEGSGGADVSFIEAWDGFHVTIRSNVIDAIRACIRDLFAAGGEIAGGAVVDGIQHGAQALDRLFGPELRKYLVYWQFTFDLGPEGNTHYVLVQHRNRYRAVLQTSTNYIPGTTVGTSTQSNTVNFDWKWKEQVWIRGALLDCDTQDEGGETIELTRAAYNATVIELRSRKNITVELQTQVSLHYNGLTGQLSQFETELRGMLNAMAGATDANPPSASATAGVVKKIREIDTVLNALIRTWEGAIDMQKSMIYLTCLTKPGYDRIRAEIIRQKAVAPPAEGQPPAAPAIPSGGTKGTTGKALPGGKLGAAHAALANMKPGDDAVYYVPTAWSADEGGELVPGAFKHVRMSVMSIKEVAAFNAKLESRGDAE